MVRMLFIGGLGMPEVIFLVALVLLFFGGKKIPEMMRGLGKGVKSFKEGMNGIDAPEESPKSSDTTNEQR